LEARLLEQQVAGSKAERVLEWRLTARQVMDEIECG
jgi:hypothetical protein